MYSMRRWGGQVHDITVVVWRRETISFVGLRGCTGCLICWYSCWYSRDALSIIIVLYNNEVGIYITYKNMHNLGINQA